jgi:glutathione synthase
MKTLFVMDPLERINVTGDSTWMLMKDAARRGWPVWFCTPRDLYVENGRASARCAEVALSDSAPHFRPAPASDQSLAGFDVVWMRKDPPFDMDYVFSTYLLDLVGERTLVLNNPRSIRNCNEKLFAMAWPHFQPGTLLTHEIRRAMAWIQAAPGRVVIKPWDGNGGRGVLVTEKSDQNLRSMLELLTGEERQYIIVQHYVPEVVNGDKRIILVDGEPRGQVLRVPQPGDHRGNMHAGAKVQACDLSPRDLEVCAAIGPALREMGLLFVGIDMLGDWLTEINVTSPTGIQEINRLMGVQLEAEVSDAVLRRVEAQRR